MNELSVELVDKDSVVRVSSRQVAEKFGKEHRRVLQTIDEKLSSIDVEFSQHNFVQSTYLAGNGKSEREMLMTRDGFTFIAMGFTGQEADTWKIKFIQAFNAMEQKLQAKQAMMTPQTYLDALKALVAAEEAKQVAILEAAKAKETVEYFESREGLVSLQEAMRQLKIMPNKGIAWLRSQGYLTQGNQPTALLHAKDGAGEYFAIKTIEDTKKTARQQTLVTQCGIVWLRSLSWPKELRVA